MTQVRLAERLWRDAKIPGDDLFTALAEHLRDAHRATVKIERVQAMGGAESKALARVFPPPQASMKVDENVRGVSFYAPVP